MKKRMKVIRLQKPIFTKRETTSSRVIRASIKSALLVLILGGMYIFATRHDSSVRTAQSAHYDQDVESYIRSKVVETQVSPGREPVALYFKNPGMQREKFCCVGTVFKDKVYGMVVLTAEHVFRTDLDTDQQISFRPLRTSIVEPTYYFDHIVKTSREMGGLDAVLSTFGDTPKMMKRFSGYVYREISKNFYADVEVAGKKIPSMRSLVSGESVATFGYCRIGEGSNGPISILIEYSGRPGESGTGFVDDYDGLWIIHATPEPTIEKEMLNDYEQLMHKKVNAACVVVGPFGGNYK